MPRREWKGHMQGVQMDEVLAAPQIVQLHCRPMIFNAQNMRPRGLQDGTYRPADHTGKNMRKPLQRPTHMLIFLYIR